jgi:PPOX class probable F420-dependent enzyme
MAAIPDEAKHLFQGKHLAHVATINADGTPQVSAVWIALDGDLVTFNTAEDRVKTRNLRNNPAVAISITNEANPFDAVILQGKVVEFTHEGARADVDVLAKRYLETDTYPFALPDAVRVIVKIEPEKVSYLKV